MSLSNPHSLTCAITNTEAVVETLEEGSDHEPCGNVRKKIDHSKYTRNDDSIKFPCQWDTPSSGRSLKRPRCRTTFGNEEISGICLEENISWELKNLLAGYGSRFTMKTSANDSFPMLRMEHREGGTMAKHTGEERILLFCEDCPGAVAKIVYSSVGSTGRCCCTTDGTADIEKHSCIAQAKIHVLNVKESYRGYDLGGLLFMEAIASLKRHYSAEYEDVIDGNDDNVYITCQLDAEEDSRRHNKLVNFYENLGCKIKSQAKIQYINNNDGETYRKIPMQIYINVSSSTSSSLRDGPLWQRGFLDRQASFCPIRFRGPREQPISLSGDHSIKIDWILVDLGDGKVELRTTIGHRIAAFPGGGVYGRDCSDDEYNTTMNLGHSWSQFSIIQISPSDISPGENAPTQFLECTANKAGSKSIEKQQIWWLLQSAHGTYLTIDEFHFCLQCSAKPSFWKVDQQHLTLRWTGDTPFDRDYYLRKWHTQTVEYVQRMREKYFTFRLCSMSLYEALQKAKSLHETELSVVCKCGDGGGSCQIPSLRSLCFRRADWFRRHGYPDWIQFLGLIYSLGIIVRILDPDRFDTSKVEDEESSCLDWIVPSQSWVVGCPPPLSSIIHAEFCSKNPDLNQGDSRYSSSPQGMYDACCGLENVLLTWSTQQYMFGLLRHNQADLPDEATFLLQYTSLRVWHTEMEYGHFTNERDTDFLPFLTDFEAALREATTEATDRVELSDRDCEHLWCDHLESVAEKYGLSGVLDW